MPLLKPIRQRKVSDQVFEQLKELIYRRKLKPGEQLMPERDMAKSMKVSRSTVRNAINRLVAMQLIDHKQGKGTFVAVPASKKTNPFAETMSSNKISLYDLLEVRIGLECTAAAKAAKRADSSDINAIEHSIREMKEAIIANRFDSKTDITFHMAIAYATKNPLHIQVMKFFYDNLSHGMGKELHFKYDTRGKTSVILNHHKEIAAAIKDKDPNRAYQAMHDHIDFVKKYCRKEKKVVFHPILRPCESH